MQSDGKVIVTTQDRQSVQIPTVQGCERVDSQQESTELIIIIQIKVVEDIKNAGNGRADQKQHSRTQERFLLFSVAEFIKQNENDDDADK